MDILNTSHNKDDVYVGKYNETILSSVKRQILQDFTTFEDPENQLFSVLHIIFKDNTLRYFTDYVITIVWDVYEAFKNLREHVIKPAHRDTYDTERKSLRLSTVREKYPTKIQNSLILYLNVIKT